MRYPTHLNDIQSSISQPINLVNKVLDLSGTNFTAFGIEFNYNNTRQLNIRGSSCVIGSSIRVNKNLSTEMKKPDEIFSFDSAVIKDMFPPRDLVGSEVKIFNNIIEFTNPRINIPTSVITAISGKATGIINITAAYTKTITQITNIVVNALTCDVSVLSTAGLVIGNDVQILNVGSSFNTTFNTAKISAIPNPTTVRITYSNPMTGTPLISSDSALKQETVNITNGFIYLQDLIITISGGKAIPDLNGAPALVSAEDDSLYVSFISRYTSNIFYLGYSNTLYDIVVAHVFKNGTLDWIHHLDGLVTSNEESTPIITIGDQNDLYIAYMTTGSTSGNLNGIEILLETTYSGVCGCADVLSCTDCGYEDIVIARINPTGASQSVPPNIVWKVQGGYINSIYRETKPSICVDTANQLVYLAYQCNKNIACFTPIGSSNILLHCFTMSGQHLWVKAQAEINSTGANTSPSIAADNLGNVYIAFEIKAPSSGSVNVGGGAYIPANEKQIEVIRFQTVLSSPNESNTYNPLTTYTYGTWVYYSPTALWYQVKVNSVVNIIPGSSSWSEPYPVNVAYVQRVWVLSQSVNIFAVNGISGDEASQPSIAADRKNGNIFLTFLTTGNVYNVYDTYSSVHELVLLSLTKDRIVRWIYQGGDQFNSSKIKYNDSDLPNIIMDRFGNILVSLITYLSSGAMNLAVFYFDQFGESRWGYNTSEIEKYPGYMWASTNAPNAVFLDSPPGSFSKIGIGKAYTNIFFGTITDLLAPGQTQVGISGITNMACISRFTESNYFMDRNAFSYIVNVRSICSCGGNENCGCLDTG